MVNIEEIRVYYESLEQAEFFIKPIIEKIFQKHHLDVPIKIVQLYKSRNNKNPSYLFYSKSIASIIYRKNPDILVTAIQKNKEEPLCLIEISAAVFTEDHELQRFDALDTALANNCVGIKISSFRRSRSSFGGNTNYDHHEMYAILFKKHAKHAFFLEWPTTSNGFAVSTDGIYLSNPSNTQYLSEILSECIDEVLQNGYTEKYLENIISQISKIEYFSDWIKTVEDFELQSPESLSSSRTKWHSKHPDVGIPALEIKVNRMGHEMNPENGMINKYGSQGITQTTRFVFDESYDRWYTYSSNEQKIKDFVKETKLKTAYDFLHCFLLGTNLIKFEEFKKLDKQFQDSNDLLIDISLKENDLKCFNEMKKELKIIFSYSELIKIQNKNEESRVIFRWDKSKLLSLNTNNLSNITPITQKRMGETEVTYVSAHYAFREKLDCDLVHISYPGELGTPFLPEPEDGRAQKRIYFDIISKTENNVYICESKSNDLRGVMDDVEKLSIVGKYSKTFHEKFLSLHFDIADSSVVKVGVSFIEPESFSLDDFMTETLSLLDYFILLKNSSKKYCFYSKNNNKWNLEIEDDFVLPTRYEVVKKKLH